MKPKSLETRIEQQNEVLSKAAAYVKPGGRLLYATCSFLVEEDEDRVDAFLANSPGWVQEDAVEHASESGLLTDEGLAMRDRYVVRAARERELPIASALGGGYGDDQREVAARHARSMLVMAQENRRFPAPLGAFSPS